MRQVAGGYTQVIIRTKTTSVNPDPCVRWQEEIPQVVIRTHTVLLPRPVRSQVACEDTQGLSAHTHKSVTPTSENWVTCRDTQGLSVHTFILPRPVRSQVACRDTLYSNPHTFRRQKCLQSLHAFKRRQCQYISKMTMSSAQKLQYLFPLCFVGLDDLCWHAFKKRSENENELNEKRRNFNVFMPSRVLLLGFVLVASQVKIQLEPN